MWLKYQVHVLKIKREIKFLKCISSHVMLCVCSDSTFERKEVA